MEFLFFVWIHRRSLADVQGITLDRLARKLLEYICVGAYAVCICHKSLFQNEIYELNEFEVTWFRLANHSINVL